MKVKFLNLDRMMVDIRGDLEFGFKRILDTNGFVSQGGYLDWFETEWAEANGCRPKAVGVSSGTGALEVALMACGIGIGDEVITVPNSFFATTEAIVNVGAQPVFVDVEKDTGLMNMDLVENHITDKTKALLPVHLFGQPVDLEKAREICDTHQLTLIQDAAQAHLAKFKDKHLVEYGDVVCYSHYPGKNLGAITDGGSILTKNGKIYDNCWKIRNHGREHSVKYDHSRFGTNARMCQITAMSLGFKMRHIEKWTNARRHIAKYYDKHLKVPHMVERPERTGVYHLYPLVTHKRDELQAFLKEKGISTGIHYPIIIPLLGAYTSSQTGDYLNWVVDAYPVAYRLSQELISLPMCPYMTTEEMTYVVECVNEFFEV